MDYEKGDIRTETHFFRKDIHWVYVSKTSARGFKSIDMAVLCSILLKNEEKIN